jgi:transketolase N-terminal domain/subunit
MDLIARARGDEKHDASSYSTLEVIDALYDVMRFNPEQPTWDGRDRFILSKGHGPLAFYAVLIKHGFFPAEEMERFLTWDGISAAIRTVTACRVSRHRRVLSVTACRWPSASPTRSVRAASTSSASSS